MYIYIYIYIRGGGTALVATCAIERPEFSNVFLACFCDILVLCLDLLRSLHDIDPRGYYVLSQYEDTIRIYGMKQKHLLCVFHVQIM